MRHAVVMYKNGGYYEPLSQKFGLIPELCKEYLEEWFDLKDVEEIEVVVTDRRPNGDGYVEFKATDDRFALRVRPANGTRYSSVDTTAEQDAYVKHIDGGKSPKLWFAYVKI